MVPSPTRAGFLRSVTASAVPQALTEVLRGGPPIAPLPESEPEHRMTLEMLGLDQPIDEPDAAVVLTTSGSTGQPKGVVLSRAAITASVTATHARLGGPGDWVLALPTHYVAGLMVVARAVIAGTAVHQVSADLRELPEVCRAITRPRYVSLVPTQLFRACADHRLAAALSTFDAVLLGGAAADPQLLKKARAQGIPVVTTYGMSETCGGCVYDGAPLDGVQVTTDPDDGRISVSGPTLFSGYRLRPELTTAALHGGWFRTQDRGRFQQDRLHILGRLDQVVISGGVNVDLDEVERAAHLWPGGQGTEIVIVGVPDLEWGTAVVAVTDGPGAELELRTYLHQLLPAAAVPQRLVRLGVLPRTAGGKIDRQRLIAGLAAPQYAAEPDAREG